MIRLLAAIVAFIQLFAPMHTPSDPVRLLRSGQWLRFHVVAHDDTAEMQRVKLCVRDAVQRCYRENRSPGNAMQQEAEALLPALTEAARASALEEGFTGNVRVTLGKADFDERELSGAVIPAGEYPALIIRLGDAAGRNWWGLLDPEAAMALASADTEGEETVWDWSWEALVAALLKWLPGSGT